MKRRLVLSLLALGILVLALAGWTVRGVGRALGLRGRLAAA